MNDARLSRLEDRLGALEQRLLALEAWTAPETDTETSPHDLSPTTPSIQSESATPSPESEATHEATRSVDLSSPSFLSLFGRFLVILGGAFLLRAGTDAGALPRLAGVTLGITYGLVQVGLAARAANRNAWQSANWFGLGAAVVIFPLIVESTIKFEILAPGLSALLLPALGFIGVAVAARTRLRPMAWAFLAGTGSVGLLLAVKTGFGVGFPLGVLIVGLAGLWLGYLRRWYGLAIVGSVVPLTLVVAVTLLIALDIDRAFAASLSPAVALTLQLSLVAGFLGSYLARALRWSAPVGVPEMTQASLAMILGIVGALVSTQKDPELRPIFAVFMLAAGLICYLISFLRIDQREGQRQNFAFFSSTALVGTLTGAALILSGWWELGLFLVASMGLALAGARLGRATLSLHAAVFLVGAGFASGLLPTSLRTLSGMAATVPTSSGLLKMLLVIVVGTICCAAPVVHGGKTWGRLSRLPKAVYLLFLLITLDGLLALYMIQRFAGTAGGEVDAGIAAAIRTGALALSAVAISFVARQPKLREGARLVPLVLLLGGFALLIGDLRFGRPATQFASMALYGMALILAPRMARHARSLPL